MITRLRATAWIGLVVSIISVVLLAIVGGPTRHSGAHILGMVAFAFGASALVQSGALLWSAIGRAATRPEMRWPARALQAIGVAVAVTALLMLGLALATTSVEDEVKVLSYASLVLVSALFAALLVHFVQARPRPEENS